MDSLLAVSLTDNRSGVILAVIALTGVAVIFGALAWSERPGRERALFKVMTEQPWSEPGEIVLGHDGSYYTVTRNKRNGPREITVYGKPTHRRG